MRQIPSLNGLRAISVLFVILHHIEIYYRVNLGKPISEYIFPFFIGQLGVNVFFVISGFLITTILINEEQSTNTISLRRFYFRRTLRIFPAYYFLLLVYFILQLCGLFSLPLSSWLTSFTYTKDIRQQDWYTFHFWSLSLEEQFYLLWPFIFKYMKPYRHVVAFCLVLIVPLLRAGGYFSTSPWFGTIYNIQRLDGLMWGCLFAIYHDSILAKLKLLLAKNKFLIVAPFIVMITGYYLSTFGFIQRHNLSAVFVAIGGESGTFTYLLIGLIMLISIHCNGNGLYNFLNYHVLNYVGVLSYSIYLWQQLFINTGFYLSSVPLNLLVIFIVANLSYYGIEKPFLRLRNLLQQKLGFEISQKLQQKDRM
jgi:peptidoglycan/LPS O-acetylase OafA/YrhL